MIYGNADFSGLPWETIVKSFRSQKGDETHEDLASYAESFLNFLRTTKTLFPKKQQDAVTGSLIYSYLLALREGVRKRLDKEAEEKNGLDDDDIPPIVTKEIKESLAAVRTYPLLDGFDKKFRDRLKSRYSSRISELRKMVFKNLPITSATSRNIATIVCEMLARKWFGPSKTGLVIAGYGTDEYMPTLLNYELEHMANGRPRFSLKQHQTISLENTSAVIPFAQMDMVQSFMEGIQNELNQHMMDTTEQLFSSVVTAIVDLVKTTDAKLAKKLSSAIQPNVDNLTNELFEDWKKRRMRYWSPVIQIVGTLPKDELAAMAESLVNLTKFRRRVTNVRETVGGPIDVAVITKGDGFVWVKRKHYFSPDLNPRYVARIKGSVCDV